MRGMLIDNEFEIGQTVYLRTDKEQDARIVTGIRVRGGSTLVYDLSCGMVETCHFGMEMAAERNAVKVMES